MKRELVRNIFSMIIISAFIVVSTNLATAEEREPTTVTKGTIVTVNSDTGTIVIEDELEKVLSLTAESWIELASFNDGDKVIFEYTPQGLIKSMNKIE